MIFYFSGTGNTKWVAEQLARDVREKCYNIASLLTEGTSLDFHLITDERVGICFPIYGWGIPPVVVQFIEKLTLQNYRSNYIYFCCTCGDDIGQTREEVEQRLAAKGWQLQAGFSIQMPDSYVCLPGFDVDKEEEREEKLGRARAFVSRVADFIVERKCTFHITPGRMAWTKSHVFKPFFFKFLVNEKKFHVDADRCIHCHKCIECCPLKNLELKNDVPSWMGHCCNCLACYHNCPVHAINYGKQTRKKGQYVFKPRTEDAARAK